MPTSLQRPVSKLLQPTGGGFQANKHKTRRGGLLFTSLMLDAHAVKINGQCLPDVKPLHYHHHLVATVYTDPGIIVKNEKLKKINS